VRALGSWLDEIQIARRPTGHLRGATWLTVYDARSDHNCHAARAGLGIFRENQPALSAKRLQAQLETCGLRVKLVWKAALVTNLPPRNRKMLMQASLKFQRFWRGMSSALPLKTWAFATHVKQHCKFQVKIFSRVLLYVLAYYF